MSANQKKERPNLPRELVQRGFLYTLLTLVLGVTLAFWPGESVGISFILGAVGMMVLGLWRIYKYFCLDDAAEGMEHQVFAGGLVLAGGGLLMLIHRTRLADLLSLVAVLLLLVAASIRLQAAIDLKRMDRKTGKRWLVPLVVGLLHVIAGAVLLIFDLQANNVYLVILGAMLMAEALCDLWTRLIIRMLEKHRASTNAAESALPTPAAPATPPKEEAAE